MTKAEFSTERGGASRLYSTRNNVVDNSTYVPQTYKCKQHDPLCMLVSGQGSVRVCLHRARQREHFTNAYVCVSDAGIDQ